MPHSSLKTHTPKLGGAHSSLKTHTPKFVGVRLTLQISEGNLQKTLVLQWFWGSTPQIGWGVSSPRNWDVCVCVGLQGWM